MSYFATFALFLLHTSAVQGKFQINRVGKKSFKLLKFFFIILKIATNNKLLNITDSLSRDFPLY